MGILEFFFGIIYSLYEEIQFRIYHGPVFHRLINNKYGYYTNLPWPLKMKFLHLVRDHYKYFEFQSRQKMSLTLTQKVTICSAASQLVMYLPSESLTFFTRIVVYPDYYTSVITSKVHKGEVNPGFHTIVFSWRGVEEGLSDPGDGRNLLLHEFAHALWLEHKLVGHEYAVLDSRLIKQFEELAELEMEHIQGQEDHFFRKYAFSNLEEYFAVAVESFFERPEKFKEQLPELYASLTSLLLQDPIKMKFK